MKFKYIYILLSLLSALCSVTADAQIKHKKAKKPAAKVVRKKTFKPVVAAKKAAKPVAVQKSLAKSLGDDAAKVKVDTSKKVAGAGSLSEEIVVTTAYKPVLADAVKIRINPDLEDKSPFKAPLTYFPIDKRLELNTDIKPFNAMKMPKEQDSDLTNNYVKVGLGSLKTSFGEAFFDNGRDQALQVGGFLKHFAQNGNLHDQNSNREEVGVFAKSIFQETSLSGRVNYNYRGNYFYGFDESGNPPTNFQLDKQHFSTISAEGELTKNYKDAENDLTYAVKLSGYMFNNAYQAKESNVVLSGFLNETINQFHAGLSGSVDVATQQDSLYDYNNSFVRLDPYLRFQGDSYKIEAGVNIVDNFGFTSSFHIFPAAKLELQLIPKYLRIFVEAKGDVNRSSLLDFSNINPFLGQDVPIKNSIDQLDIAAGLKGTIAPGLGFKATIFRDEIKDMPLFISNFNFAAGYNRFTVMYANGTTRVNGLNGELDFKASDDVDIFARAEFKQYQMATATEQPWNLPKFKMTAGTTVHINNKVDVTGSMYIRGSALDPYTTTSSGTLPGTQPAYTTIPSFVDLSGEVEYKATNRISVFVHVNNILAGTNQTCLYYPDYGLNVFGGVGFKF
jgi:hypothetical protein